MGGCFWRPCCGLRALEARGVICRPVSGVGIRYSSVFATGSRRMFSNGYFGVVSDEADMEFAFRGKAATDSDLIRPPIPRQNGQSGWSCDRVRWVILTGDRRGAQTIATQKHDTRPPYVFLTALGVRDDRSQSLTVDTTKDIPLRMRQTRMPQHNGESQIGLFCSNQTTRTPAADQMVRWPRKIGQVLKFRLFRQ